MITHIKRIVQFAQGRKIAVGAFNTYNLESSLAIIRAAVKTNSPAIIQISEATIKYAGLKTILDIIIDLDKAEGKKVPIAIHLDHGKDFKIVADCIKAGLSSVHMDGSALPFEQNAAITKKAVQLGHSRGVWVQGELGALFGKEGMTNIKVPKNPDEYMTDPRQAQKFAQITGVDTLAISIGTMHGNFAGREKINFDRLKKIRKLVKVPLVLHGASGTKDAEVKQAVKLGIRIINIDTDLRIAFTSTLKKTLSKKIVFYDPRKILAPSIDAVAQEVEHKIKVFSSR